MIDGVPSCSSGGALCICRFGSDSVQYTTIGSGPDCPSEINAADGTFVQVSVNGSDWVDGKVAYEVNFFIVILTFNIHTIIFIVIMNTFGSFCGCPTYMILKNQEVSKNSH